MMASGKSAKKNRNAKSAPVVRQRQGLPWLTIGAVGVIVALAVVIGVVVINSQDEKNTANAALAAWVPSTADPDPSVNIAGIFTVPAGTYKASQHVSSAQRVAYDSLAENLPPTGGPHDQTWAACNGVVYDTAVRNENMVHPLEHGAIWIAYNPDTIDSGDLDILKGLVDGQPYMMLSPYPNLPSKISLQAWEHRLQVDSATDERVMQFITALRQNTSVYPEIGATCSQPTFNIQNPPAFDATAPGADAIPMSGEGATNATNESAGATPAGQSPADSTSGSTPDPSTSASVEASNPADTGSESGASSAAVSSSAG